MLIGFERIKMKRKPKQVAKPTITFEQLAAMAEVPEIPQHYKDKLWRTVKVAREVKITEETEHFLNILCLHFGLGRNDIITHSIHLLWKEVVDSISTPRLLLYEEKLEILRLHRLEEKEAKQVRKAEAIRSAIIEFGKENVNADPRANYTTWSYRHDKPVTATPRKFKGE